VTDAHDADDTDPELRELLARAAQSPTVHRERADVVVDEHRDRVNEAADRVITEQADLLGRLRDHDADDVDERPDVSHTRIA